MELSRSAYFLILLLLGIAIMPFFGLCFFSVPSADDFYFAARANEMAFIDYIGHFYGRFTGRLFPVSLFYLSPLSLRAPEWQFIIPLAGVIGLLSGFLFLSRRLSSKDSNYRGPLLLALFMFLLYLQRLPSPAETLYWTSGVLFYGIPLVLFLFWLGLALRPGKSITSLIIIALLSFLLSVSNEVLPIPMLGILVLLWIDSEHRSSNFKSLIFISISLITGLIILFLAPGNYARMDDFSHTPDLPWAAWMALHNIAKAVAYQLQNPALPFAILLFLAWTSGRGIKILPAILEGKQGTWLLAAGVPAILWAMYFPSLYFSSYVPWRIHNTSSLIILITLIIILIRVSKSLNQFRLPAWVSSFLLITALLTLFIDFQWRGRSSSIEFRGNVALAWYELIEKARTYHSQQTQRLTEAEVSKGKALHFSGFDEVPLMLHFTGITSDPKHDLNRWYAEYFSLLEASRDSLSAE
jgi:hypothetical protein